MAIRVVIADDHAMLRGGLRAMLERDTEIEIVAEAGDGITAIRAVAEHRPDVLVLDISMPGLRGPAVAESVLGDQPELAIVVLTVHDDVGFLREMFRVGARGYVVKTSGDRELIAAIRRTHGGGRHVDSSLADQILDLSGGGPRKLGRRQTLLTPRETQICSLLAHGHTNAEVGDQLCISERTVETHRAHLLEKIEGKTRADIVHFALEHGLLRPS